MAFVVTAVAAAIEVTTVATVLTAVSAVGMAMTVVGAVTGNKDLMKVGGVIGLAGGVGSLVNGAIDGAAAAGAADAAASGAADAAAAGSDAATIGATDMGGYAAGDVTSNLASSGIDAANTGAATGMGASNLGSTAAIGAPDAAGASLSGAPFSAATPNGSTLGSGMYSGDAPVDMSTGISTPAGAPTDFASSVRSAGYSPADSAITYGTSQSTLDQIINKVGSAWRSMSPQGKAEIVRSALAIPGGIQSQKNNEAMLALNQQKVNQTSYGSSVPTFGIIAKAQKGY